MGNSRNRSIWSRFMSFINRAKNTISQSSNRNRYNSNRQQKRPVKVNNPSINRIKNNKAYLRATPAHYLPKPAPKPRQLDSATLKKQLKARNVPYSHGEESRIGNFLKSKGNQYLSNTMKFVSNAGDNAQWSGRMRRYGKQLDNISKSSKAEEDKWIDNTHTRSIRQMAKAKDGLSRGDKIVVDAVSSLIDSGVAVATPVGTTASLMNDAGDRTFEAERNGATKKEALKYSLLMGGGDLLLGKIMPKALSKVAKDKLMPFVASKKDYSKAFDRLNSKLSSKGESKNEKNALYHMAKRMKPAASGAAEDAMSEIISPFIKNHTYSKNEKIDWKDVLREGAYGAIGGEVYGKRGNVVKHSRTDNRAGNKSSGKQQNKKLKQSVMQDYYGDKERFDKAINQEIKKYAKKKKTKQK